MPINHQQRKVLRERRHRLMMEVVRAQHAPITDPDTLYKSILDETTKLGLPESDALWFYHKMQLDQWRWGGVPVRDFRRTMQSIHQHQFFPSMRTL